MIFLVGFLCWLEILVGFSVVLFCSQETDFFVLICLILLFMLRKI